MKTTKAVGIGIATFSLLLCGCCGLVTATSPNNDKPTNTTTSRAPNLLRTSSPSPSPSPSPSSSPSRASQSPSAAPTPTEDDWEVIEDEDDDIDFGTVTPGAYCSTRGAKGVSKTGKTYTCKGPGRLRWRR